MQVPNTLAYLTGRWQLRRLIVDHRAGLPGEFTGEAKVETCGARGRYEETGRLRFGRHASSARRALELIETGAGPVAVHFADGRPFFELDLAAGSAQAVHLCSADRYELHFSVASADLLVERWRVRGPEKDYAAETTWQRRAS